MVGDGTGVEVVALVVVLTAALVVVVTTAAVVVILVIEVDEEVVLLTLTAVVVLLAAVVAATDDDEELTTGRGYIFGLLKRVKAPGPPQASPLLFAHGIPHLSSGRSVALVAEPEKADPQKHSITSARSP